MNKLKKNIQVGKVNLILIIFFFLISISSFAIALENINGKLTFWLPEVTITEVIVQQNLDQYKVSITLNYSISLDESEDSIQINYS